MTTSPNGPLRVGVGGPVGTGKTALMDALCKHFRDRYDIAAITNDIYTKEDAEFLTRAGSLPPERILGIETGGCPHTAIREDASDQPRRRRRSATAVSRPRPDPDRKRRRQSGRDLQSGTGGSDDLRDRRLGRRQDPAQGRPRHHPQRPAGDQQDRPRAVRRRQPRGDGPRRHARCAASGRSCSPTSARARAWPTSPRSSRSRAACAPSSRFREPAGYGAVSVGQSSSAPRVQTSAPSRAAHSGSAPNSSRHDHRRRVESCSAYSLVKPIAPCT